ncbi:MAG: choline/carnitine O-acyltransferase [Gammaproteobacteria bacterium]|jgi:hypothetical protein
MNSYEVLKIWLKNDLGCITNLSQLVMCIQNFLKDFKTQAQEDKIFLEKVINPMQEILQAIKNKTLDNSEKIDKVNQLLKNIFINSFFTEEFYAKRLEALKKTDNYEAEIISRLKSPNPLVTLDVIGIFKDDLRNLSQTERAATVIYAAVKIYMQLNQKKSMTYDGVTLTWENQGHYFGHTVITTDHGNTIHSASQPRHVTILVNGHAYYLSVIHDDGKILSAELLQSNLEAIISDCKDNNYRGALGSITAAPRKLCHEVRKELEKRSENARFLQLIDDSLLVVCLDQNENITRNREKQIKEMFTNFSNRWYGTTQFVVNSTGKLGIINSYTRGDNLYTACPLFSTIVDVAFTVPIKGDAYKQAENYQLRKLKFDVEENELSPLIKAAEVYFHQQHSICNLDIGLSFFIKRKLNPDAAMQLLIMLAARDIDAQKKLPIFKHALTVKDAASTGSLLDWTFIPTHKINEFITAVIKKELTNTELFNLFKEAVAYHANTIQKTQEGWSPTYFLQKPEGALYDALCKFFVSVGNKLEGGYAAYLFRPARLPGSMDILTSFHKLPKNFTMIGRPGGTLEAVSKFGAHIAFSRKNIEFSWMPNSSANIDLSELDAAVKKWVSYIEEISA